MVASSINLFRRISVMLQLFVGTIQLFARVIDSAAGTRATSGASLDLWQRNSGGTDRVQGAGSRGARQEIHDPIVSVQQRAIDATAV